MPYVQIRTTQDLSSEQIDALSRTLGSAISLIPGKTESRLMLEVVPNCRLYMAGSMDAPAAYVSVQVNNAQQEEDLKRYSKKLLDVLCAEAGIPYDRIYVTHQSLTTWHSSKAFE